MLADGNKRSCRNCYFYPLLTLSLPACNGCQVMLFALFVTVGVASRLGLGCREGFLTQPDASSPWALCLHFKAQITRFRCLSGLKSEFKGALYVWKVRWGITRYCRGCRTVTAELDGSRDVHLATLGLSYNAWCAPGEGVLDLTVQKITKIRLKK